MTPKSQLHTRSTHSSPRRTRTLPKLSTHGLAIFCLSCDRRVEWCGSMRRADCRTMFHYHYHTRRNVSLDVVHASTPNLGQARKVRQAWEVRAVVYASFFASCVRLFCRRPSPSCGPFSSFAHDTTCANNYGHRMRYPMYQMYSYKTRHATHVSDHEEYPTIHFR